jgi:hypothetical protein
MWVGFEYSYGGTVIDYISGTGEKYILQRQRLYRYNQIPVNSVLSARLKKNLNLSGGFGCLEHILAVPRHPPFGV